MKNNIVKRLLALGMTTAMVLSMAACGDSGEQPSDSVSSGSSSESTPDSGSDSGSDAQESNSGAGEKSWPDDVTLSYYIRGGTAEYEPYLYKDLVGINKIQEATGINIDFDVICGDNEAIQTQYLAMLTSNNYPDIIQWLNDEAYSGGVGQLYNDGIIIELNDLIDNYMPNLKAILEKYPNLAKDMANDDGQYLYFTKLNSLSNIDDLMSITYWGFLMRKDWLENVGMSVPTTMDEWYEVLKAFKTQDPNGNGLDDEIPFDAGAGALTMFYPAYNMLTGIYVDPDTGKIGYGEYTEKYKEFLTTMNKWYSEGLIDDIYDENYNLVGSDVTDEHIYGDIAGSWKGLANNWEQRLPGILEKNANADLVAVPWVQSTMNSKKYTPNTYYSTIDRTTVCISVDCKYPEAAATLIDYMYSEEGGLYLTWGVEGESYVTNDDGSRSWTEAADEVIDYYDGSFTRKFTYEIAHVSFPRLDQNHTRETREQQYLDACELWADAELDMIYPKAISVTQDQQNAAVGAESDIGGYIAEMQMKFITGEEPLTNFDNYLDTLKKMGIEDLIAVYQDAYDRYQAR